MNIVVVGSGVIGSAISYMLAREGARVTLVDAGGAGEAGATFYSGGILRVFDRDVALAQVSSFGVRAFRNWPQLELEDGCGYVPAGAIYLVAPDGAQSAVERAEQLASRDYPIEFVSASQLFTRLPMLANGRWGGAVLEPFGGYGDVRRTARSLAGGLRGRGEVIRGARLKRVSPGRNGKGVVLELDDRRLAADKAVIAAGIGSQRILQASGIDLVPEQRVRPRSIGVPTLRLSGDQQRRRLPHVVVDEVNRTFVRPLDQERYMVGANLDQWLEDDEIPPTLTADHIEDARRRGESVATCLTGAQAEGGVNGYDGYTDSLRPLVGPISSFPDLYLATGFSGRGYKVAPAIAAAVTRELLGRVSGAAVDLCPADIFERYRLRPEASSAQT